VPRKIKKSINFLNFFSGTSVTIAFAFMDTSKQKMIYKHSNNIRPKKADYSA